MECVNVVCRNCKSGEHIIKDCPYPKNCNLCGKEDHTFRSCPQSYANRLRMPQVQQAEEIPVVTGNSAPTDVDRGHNQGNELQLEAVVNQTGADQDGEPAGSSSCQAGNVRESNRTETIQEEMEVFLSTPDLALPSTSKECRDLLDLMFPDLPMEGTKHVKFDEDFLPLPVSASKDKPPLPSELLIQPGSNDVSSSLKRQINTSTESSTGEVELDGTSHPTPPPVPQAEEQVSKVTQETTQIIKVGDNVEKVTSGIWLVSKKKKKKAKVQQN